MAKLANPEHHKDSKEPYWLALTADEVFDLHEAIEHTPGMEDIAFRLNTMLKIDPFKLLLGGLD